MATQNSIDTSLSGQTGTGSFVGSSTPTITTPKILTSIEDTNGNIQLGFTTVASAVNYIDAGNNSTTNSPTLAAKGTDTNIALSLIGKGTGGVATQGTGTNNNATAGYVGEYVTSSVVSGSAVTATANAASDVTSISLTAGDWDVFGNISWITLGTTPTSVYGWTSATSASTPNNSLRNGINLATGVLAAGTAVQVPYQRFSISTTTTIFLSGFLGNVSGNGTFCGGIFARRVR